VRVPVVQQEGEQELSAGGVGKEVDLEWGIRVGIEGKILVWERRGLRTYCLGASSLEEMVHGVYGLSEWCWIGHVGSEAFEDETLSAQSVRKWRFKIELTICYESN
jgi:hypothetical protein